MKGERRSKRRGQSVEFADYRNYVIGDDLRRIDWNVYARLDRLFLKLFLEEEDLSLYVLLDCSTLNADAVDCGIRELRQVHSRRLDLLALPRPLRCDGIRQRPCGKPEGGLHGGLDRAAIEGDAEVAQKFRELLAQAQPDFEEELSRVIGDVAARQVANFARGFLDWGRKAGGSLATNVAEYLQEEGRDLPTRTETEEFLAGVDRLRDDAERLEARLARLESRTAAAVPKRPRKQAE